MNKQIHLTATALVEASVGSRSSSTSIGGSGSSSSGSSSSGGTVPEVRLGNHLVLRIGRGRRVPDSSNQSLCLARSYPIKV